MNNIKGYVFGIVTSVTFGLIPLFTLPLMHKGMNYDSILFYRFLFATIALAIMQKAVGKSLRIDKRDIPVLLLAIAPTVISNVTLVLAVRNVGGTVTSMYGTMPQDWPQ